MIDGGLAPVICKTAYIIHVTNLSSHAGFPLLPALLLQ